MVASLMATGLKAQAADYPLTAANSGQTFLVGNGDQFTDSGGLGGFYTDNEDRTITFTAPAGLKLSVDFTSFTIESGFDFLYIFDGSDTSALPIGPPGGFSGSSGPGVVFSTGESLTFQFVSDFIVSEPGWIATIAIEGGATLGDSVFVDSDADGTKDSGELGLEGVLMELLDVNGHPIDNPTEVGFQAYTTTSDGSGNYSFNNVAAGSYQIRIATPPGDTGTSSPVTSSLDDQVDDDDNGSQSVNGGEVYSPVIALIEGEDENTVDFGFVPSLSESYILNAAPAFEWFDGSTGVVWSSTDTSKTHDIVYTDSFGNSQTVTVTMTLVDPENRNGDTASDLHGAATHPFDPLGGAAPYPGSVETDLVPGDGSIDDPWDSDLDPILTETNGEYGLDFLTMGIKTGDSSERVGYRFSFSKPVEVSNLEISGIDSIGVNFSHGVSTYEAVGDSYQDRVEVYGRNGNEPVELALVSGAELTAVNGTVTHNYDTDVSGVIALTDPLGATTVESLEAITELEIYYSNGGDDAVNESEQTDLYTYWSSGNGATYGASDDQGIRISGFDLVVADDASVSGVVEADINRDGMGDSPLSGVQLTLFTDPDGDGDPVDGVAADNPNVAGTQDYVVTSTGTGSYLFSGLLPDDYVVVQTLPASYLRAEDGDSVDGGDDAANSSGTDGLIPVSLTQSEVDDGNDFVLAEMGSLSGSVLTDTDDDGSGDLALAGVQVILKDAAGDDIDSDASTSGVQPTTTTTDGAGSYSFVGLFPTDYQVVESQPANYLSIGDADGGDPNQIAVSVFPGANSGGRDFEEIEAATLSGQVLADIDNDDAGDVGIGGVILTLRDDFGSDIDSDAGTPGVQPTTATTNGSGDYSFGGLLPNFYQIHQTQPAGYLSVGDAEGANNNIIGDEAGLLVGPGQNLAGNDFIEEEPGSLSGLVEEDTDEDGIGDAGMFGVELTLKDGAGNDVDSDEGASGIQPTIATTVSSGFYQFSDLPPGSYQVVQTQPLGFDSVSDSDGANNDIIGDENAIVVVAGQDVSGNDFVEEIGKPNSFTEWQVSFATELGSEDGLTDNPDGDRHANALEYALCLHPGAGLESNEGFVVSKDLATGEVVASYSRPIENSDVSYVLEGTDALDVPTSWTAITSIVPVIDRAAVGLPDGAEKVTFEDLETATEYTDGESRGVVRLRVTIDGQNFYPDVFGWQCTEYNDYQLATFGNPFSKVPVFSGSFASTGVLTTSVDGDGNVSLDVADSAFGEDLSGTVGSNGEAYLQLTSGALEGERFDILSGGVDEVTLVHDPDIFSPADGVSSLNTRDGIPSDSLLNGTSFEVIFYHTVDEVFVRDSIYNGEEGVNPEDATRLLLYDARGTTPGFDSLLLIGTNAISSKWVYSNDLLWKTDQGNLRLEPGIGNWIEPKSSGDPANPAATAPVQQMSFGMVANHDVACPLNEGYNLLGAVWPYDQSAAGSNGKDLKVTAGFDGGTTPVTSTELFFWEGDLVVDDSGVGTYSAGYLNYMLLDGGGMQNWIDINDITMTNQDDLLIFRSHRATILKLLTGDQKKPHIYPYPAF